MISESHPEKERNATALTGVVSTSTGEAVAGKAAEPRRDYFRSPPFVRDNDYWRKVDDMIDELKLRELEKEEGF